MARILAVDDSPSVRELLKFTLSQAGHEVLVASDGVEGLEVVQKQALDLVVTDINMPRMNGIDFIKALRAAGRQYLPVLVLTTEANQKLKDEARKAGATGWVVKPFEPNSFNATIKRVLP